MNKLIKSIVGVESIFFIFESLLKLKEKILIGMDTKQHSFVAQFFNTSEDPVSQLRSFVYQDCSA